MTWIPNFLSPSDDERKQYWREKLTDSHHCPNCSEPIGRFGNWAQILRNTEKGAVVANNECPYCQQSIYLTADNRVVVFRDELG